ncbi:MAG: hypothetical protein NC331_11425 [Lachnospiraceae bacterium]|nr:hypothetical protein [Lachnospiraceae bacterium]MCM1239978.1 hypothetical protein [Lachnospiraceae bacterium]
MSRELPILFNTEMVRAILDGRKTATRRICRDGNDYTIPDMEFYDPDKRTYAIHSYADREHTEKLSISERTCPVCPGDILYARETWSFISCMECAGDGCCGKAPALYGDRGCYLYKAALSEHADPGRTWRPSIHMPKAAARIWLKVTDVGVAHLQAMELDDFLDEGVVIRPEAFNDPGNACRQAREQFAGIWDRTMPKGQQALYGWDADPWVWAIGFERCVRPGKG